MSWNTGNQMTEKQNFSFAGTDIVVGSCPRYKMMTVDNKICSPQPENAWYLFK